MRGRGWLQVVRPESLDVAVPRRRGASPPGRSRPRNGRSAWPHPGRAERGRRLRRGGDFASDALDTALASRHEGARPAGGPRVAQALAALQSLSRPDGGWPSVHGGETSTLVTAEVLLAIQDWRDLPAAAALEASALAATMTHRNPDGGFSRSPARHTRPRWPSRRCCARVRHRRSPPRRPTGSERSQLAERQLERKRIPDRAGARGLRSSLGGNLVILPTRSRSSPTRSRGDAARVTARVRVPVALRRGDGGAALDGTRWRALRRRATRAGARPRRRGAGRLRVRDEWSRRHAYVVRRRRRRRVGARSHGRTTTPRAG